MKKTIKSFALGAFLASTIAFSPIASADTADGASLMSKSWNEIVETAKGGEVNWFLWGGADHINQYVTEYVGGVLKDEYNITLNRVPLTDTAAAVNTVLSEKESGVNDKGTVDMIWINGEKIELDTPNKDENFLLYIAHESPHYPFQGRNSEKVREIGKDFIWGLPENKNEIYKEMIEVMDEGVGKVINLLYELNID